MARGKPASRSATSSTKPTTPTALNATRSNWDRRSDQYRSGKGTKPLPDPVTIKQVVLLVILHVCRRIVFVNIRVKVIVYLMLLLFGSLIGDFIPLPRVYFAQKTNVLNVYFVKLAWFWTLLLVGAFVLLSSYTYCCGDKLRVRKHMTRLFIATLFWYVWTSLFIYIETVRGFCSNKLDTSKVTCIRNGNRWYGFDISGHAFILIYSSLVILEEAMAMRGWERIGDLIRNYSHDEDSPLNGLSDSERILLRVNYEFLGPYVKSIFIALTMLTVLWDFMLVCTILYFHSTAQKLVGGLFAVFTWGITYRIWFTQDYMSPGLPGKGPFRYADVPKKSFEVRNVTNGDQCDRSS